MIDAPPGARQDGGDARPGVGDVAAVAGTNGAGSGTSGTRPDRSVLARGWALIAVVAAAVTTVNALSAQTDLPQVEAWKPWTWELTSGVMPGHVIHETRGTGGFGYDVLFVADDRPGLTTAELSVEDKDAISHRGWALRRMAPIVARILG